MFQAGIDLVGWQLYLTLSHYPGPRCEVDSILSLELRDSHL